MNREQYEKFKERAKKAGLHLDKDGFQKHMEEIMSNPSARVNYLNLMK
jgi:hypothetical protein